MNLDLAQSAVSAALSGNWKEAIDSNKKILKENPKDVDALNRIARAYTEIGEIKKAKTNSLKALKIDPFNRIALKAIKKLDTLKTSKVPVSNGANHKTLTHRTFLEEPGKTAITTLLFPGDTKTIATLDCGDEVLILTNNHRVNIETTDGKYIGRLADDFSSRLRKLLLYGNEYKVYVKSVDDSNIKVFIQETFRSKKMKETQSFPSEKIEYASFTPPELVHKKDKPEVTNEEES